MGPLLLLTATLFSCWTVTGAYTPPTFAINNVTLTVEPGSDLPRDANATLRCRAFVSTLDSRPLRHTYTFYQDQTVLYTKTSAGPEQTYSLSEVRYTHTGKYRCRVNIEGQGKESDPVKVTVTGISVPVLRLDKLSLSEGDEVKATCEAPGESGTIYFYFYADGKEVKVQEVRGETNRVDTHFLLSGVGTRQIHCDYTAMLPPAAVKSKKSNQVSVSIRELSLKPVLEFSPGQQVFEGDQLTISCKQVGYHTKQNNSSLILSHGRRMLGYGVTQVNTTITAMFARDSGEIECRLLVANLEKMATKTLSVIELFSVPVLSVSPAELFQGDRMLLSCSSVVRVPRRLRAEDITYAAGPEESQLFPEQEAGRFSGRAPPYHLNYTCSATARGIVKHSQALLLRPKVTVVQPKITAVSRVVLGRPFQVRCVSERGSLPINYTLWKSYDPMNSTLVSQPQQEALFTITVQQPSDVTRYTCEAVNNRKKQGVFSKRLNATVIVPLSQAMLMVLPSPADVSEGNTLNLICSVAGTPPVTFKWYRTDRAEPLHAGTTNEVSANGRVIMNHQVPDIRRNASGAYYCEALNPARTMARSELVSVEVSIASWKKGIIAGACLLFLCFAILFCVLRFKSRRGRETYSPPSTLASGV